MGDGSFIKLQEKLHTIQSYLKLQENVYIPLNQQHPQKKFKQIPLAGGCIGGSPCVRWWLRGFDWEGCGKVVGLTGDSKFWRRGENGELLVTRVALKSLGSTILGVSTRKPPSLLKCTVLAGAKTVSLGSYVSTVDT